MGLEALRNRRTGLAGGRYFLVVFPGELSWQTFLADILLTSLSHVNWPEAGFTPRRIQNGVLGRFVSKPFALGLAVTHKTVAEVG
jgi:hypothetical protein